MTRRKRSSIVHEVKESLDAIDKIGQSKRDARRAGDAGIHSLKQKENAMSDCQNFVRWCRSEQGVKSIVDLTVTHYELYIADMRARGLSSGHISNVETSLRLLQKGYEKRCEGVSSRFSGFCPEKRLETHKTKQSIRNRAYTSQEVELIRENCSSEVRKAVDLMCSLGLRVKEAVNVRVEHFNVDKKCLHIERGAGITKGGRFRDVPIPIEFVPRLQQLLANKASKERLVRVSSTTVRDGINTACKKAEIEQKGRGAHGFRHFYARNRMQELATVEQQQMMQRILSNREIGRKADYGMISEYDKQLYVTTKRVMDTIHGELGHGENRWELAMRYLK